MMIKPQMDTPGLVHDKPVDQHRIKFRQKWLTFHLFLALSAGFLFVLLGLTGSINVFRWEIDALLNPEVEIVKSDDEYRSLKEIMNVAQMARPNCEGNWSLQLPGDVSPMALVRCHDTQSEQWFSLKMIWVNLYTAEVVSNRTFGEFFATWIYDLHWSLLLGENGHIFVGFLGLILILSLSTGLYLWWPSTRRLKQALSIKRKTSAERLVFDLHKTFGLYALPVLFILAFSGTYLVFPEYVKPVVNLFSTVSVDPVAIESLSALGRIPISIDEAVALANSVFPDGEPKWINMPDGVKGAYLVLVRRDISEVNEWFNRSYGGSAVAIDQYSGRILEKRDSKNLSAGETFLAIQWAFHYGEALGLPGRIMWCMVGFVPLVLYVTGIIRWLQKRRSRKSKRNRNSLLTVKER